VRFVECLKSFRAPHELGELWNFEYELMEEGDPDRVEQGGIDPSYEVVQVFAQPLEHKASESGQDGACWRQGTSALLVGARQTGFELDGEIFEAG
jgi:hypothetical protein